MPMIKVDEKKLIIHMNNGDEYHITENDKFDKSVSFSLSEFAENIAKLPTRFVNITKANGYDIKYVSRFAINELEEVTFRIEKISSIDLLEAN